MYVPFHGAVYALLSGSCVAAAVFLVYLYWPTPNTTAALSLAYAALVALLPGKQPANQPAVPDSQSLILRVLLCVQ